LVIRQAGTASGNSAKNATIPVARTDIFSGMKRLLLISVSAIFVLAVCALSQTTGGQAPQSASTAAQAPAVTSPASTSTTPAQVRPPSVTPDGIPIDQENARKAKAIIDEGILALGGDAYLTIHTKQVKGRTFSFYHGRGTSNGIPFWGFSEYPDKDRTELTLERDIAYVYIGDKAYEITYKGAHPVEPKDLKDYLRRRKFSLDVVLRTWVNNPKVALFYDGYANADQHPAQQVTLINADDEAVTIYFDNETHLPIKKSFTWRDPVDRQKNVEEETYGNYRVGQGIWTPWTIVRSFNGDTANERFLNSVDYNYPLDQRMFDPNSGYNPNKPSGKH
jgi:hypothetical protein